MAARSRAPSSIAAVAVLASLSVAAPAHAQSPTFGLGRTPTPEEIRTIDIGVTPDGQGLPPGSGTAEAGKKIFESRCVACHGATAKEGPQDVLVGGQGTLNTAKPIKTIGSYWPYATTLWDYVNRAMPFDHPGTLPTNDVYSATAYLLYLNGIVGEHDVLDQTTLPRVKMPNREGFIPDTRPDTGAKPATRRHGR
jgi:cytochrome c